MVIENTGGMRPPDQARQLQDALGGNPVRQVEAPRPETAREVQPQRDQVTLADQLEVTLRTTNRNFQRIQERIVSNQITLEALGDIQNEIRSLREQLQVLADEPMDLDLVSQTVRNITALAENARFNNVPLLDDFTAEGLGLTRIEPEMQRQEVGQRLLEATAQVEDRLDEVRQEDAVDRRELRALEVGLENLTAARNTERPNAAQEVEANLRVVRQEIPRQGAGEMTLTPDRVLELI